MGMLSFFSGKKEESRTMSELGFGYKPVEPRTLTDEERKTFAAQDDKIRVEISRTQIALPAQEPQRGFRTAPEWGRNDGHKETRIERDHDAHLALAATAERNVPAKDAAHATQNKPQAPPIDYEVTDDMRGHAARLRSEIQQSNISQARQREMNRGHEPIL